MFGTRYNVLNVPKICIFQYVMLFSKKQKIFFLFPCDIGFFFCRYKVFLCLFCCFLTWSKKQVKIESQEKSWITSKWNDLKLLLFFSWLLTFKSEVASHFTASLHICKGCKWVYVYIFAKKCWWLSQSHGYRRWTFRKILHPQ